MPSPALDDDPGFLERVEDLPVEQFVPELRVKALDVAVLPWAARGDVSGLAAYGGDPSLHGLCHELRSIVGPNVSRHPAQDEQVREHIDDVNSLQLAIHPDGQALAGELIDDVEHPDLPSIMGSGLHEVVGPDVVGMFRPEPDA
jgi:hypothetical protein